jgi:hypothetical protein
MEVEAYALKAAYLFGEHGISRVDTKLDYLLVVQALNNISSD